MGKLLLAVVVTTGILVIFCESSNAGPVTGKDANRRSLTCGVPSRETVALIFQNMSTVMQAFDSDRNQTLSFPEFEDLSTTLFVDGEGIPYKMSNETVYELFTIFDMNKDGVICQQELTACNQEWIQKIVNPASVLVVNDLQNEFIDGDLPLKNGPSGLDASVVIAPINKILDTIKFKQVLYVLDWHPPNHIAFFENVHLRPFHESSKIKNAKDAKVLDTVVFKGENGQPIEQKLWPRHTVMNTTGALLPPTLKIAPGSKVVLKGYLPELDSTSGFMANDKKTMTKLKEYVDEVGAQDIYVVGLIYDVCVRATVLDALALGYRTILVDDATSGYESGGIETTKGEVMELNGAVVKANQVQKMVQGQDRRPELGLYLARQLKRNWGTEDVL